jgi:hypothetical protein
VAKNEMPDTQAEEKAIKRISGGQQGAFQNLPRKLIVTVEVYR